MAKSPEAVGRMEEAAVVEEGKQIFSFISDKKLEDWKKKVNIFLHFPQNLGRMEEERQRKFRRPSRNSGKVGGMEEVVEEDINKFEVIKNIFFYFPQNIGRMEEENQREFRRPSKTSGKVGRREEVFRKRK